jgi:hypothetical protein
MDQVDLITELKKLPMAERLDIIEALLIEIRQELHLSPPGLVSEGKRQMLAAAAALRVDYLTNGELTIFSALDAEDFRAAG